MTQNKKLFEVLVQATKLGFTPSKADGKDGSSIINATRSGNYHIEEFESTTEYYVPFYRIPLESEVKAEIIKLMPAGTILSSRIIKADKENIELDVSILWENTLDLITGYIGKTTPDEFKTYYLITLIRLWMKLKEVDNA